MNIGSQQIQATEKFQEKWTTTGMYEQDYNYGYKVILFFRETTFEVVTWPINSTLPFFVNIAPESVSTVQAVYWYHNIM